MVSEYLFDNFTAKGINLHLCKRKILGGPQNKVIIQYHKLKFVTRAKHWHSFVPLKSCLWCCNIVVVANWNCQDWFISLIFRFLNKDYLFINLNKLRNRPCMSSCNSTINLFCLLLSFPFWTSDMFRIKLCVSINDHHKLKISNIVSKTSLALPSSIST